MNKVFKVEGLDCAACASELEEIISKIKGVREASVDFMAQKVRFQLRKIPELRFYLDDSLDYIEKIDNLLHQ